MQTNCVMSPKGLLLGKEKCHIEEHHFYSAPFDFPFNSNFTTASPIKIFLLNCLIKTRPQTRKVLRRSHRVLPLADRTWRWKPVPCSMALAPPPSTPLPRSPGLNYPSDQPNSTHEPTDENKEAPKRDCVYGWAMRALRHTHQEEKKTKSKLKLILTKLTSRL